MTTCFLLVGPSAAGKSSVQAALLTRFPSLIAPKGVWTRAHRPGETDATADSRSITTDAFHQQNIAGLLTAVNEVHGDWYGIPIANVLSPLAAGRDVIRIVNDEGAEAFLRDIGPHAPIVTIYLYVPIHVTVARLLSRGDPPDAIVRRVKTAEGEVRRFLHNPDQWTYAVGADAAREDVIARVAEFVGYTMDAQTADARRYA